MKYYVQIFFRLNVCCIYIFMSRSEFHGLKTLLASAVLWMLLRTVAAKPEGEALDPHLWPGAVGSDRKSDIQAVQMSFRRRVTGLNLGRVLRVEPFLLCFS